MSSKKKSKKEEEVKYFSCIICGYAFKGNNYLNINIIAYCRIIGMSDLKRHQRGKSICHFTSIDMTNKFKIQCKSCKFYFTSEEHLELHLELKLKQCQTSSNYTSTLSPLSLVLYNHGGSQTITQSSQESESKEVDDTTIKSNNLSKDLSSVIMTKLPGYECMVCGKFFRGSLGKYEFVYI